MIITLPIRTLMSLSAIPKVRANAPSYEDTHQNVTSANMTISTPIYTNSPLLFGTGRHSQMLSQALVGMDADGYLRNGMASEVDSAGAEVGKHVKVEFPMSIPPEATYILERTLQSFMQCVGVW